MNHFLLYLLESSLLLGLSYAYFRGLLQPDGQLVLNRFFLLISLLLSLLLPLLSFGWLGEMVQAQAQGLEFSLPALTILPTATMEAGATIPWMWLYWAGVGGMGLQLIWRLSAVIRLIHRFPREKSGAVILVHTSGEIPVASFFSYIFWHWDARWTEAQQQQILDHERCHVRQGHSWDALLLELLLVVAWFQPLVWLFRRLIRQNHEYLADRSAVHRLGRKAYGHLLLSQLFGQQLPIVHSFYHPPVSNRMMMLQKNSPTRWSAWKAWTTLPLFALLLVASSCTLDDQAVETAVLQAAEPKIEAHIEVDEPPKPLNLNELKVRIGYPRELANAGIEGMVVARILVDTKGQYLRHEIVNKADEGLVDAVEQQIKALKFEPALKDGKPVKFWVNIPFSFKLAE
jgi:TonB family protein